MAITVLKFVTGPIQTNTYLIYNENSRCLIIDPSSGCDKLIEFVKKESLFIEAIVLTHAHFDHFLGIPEVLNAFPGIDIYIHPLEKMILKDEELNGSVLIETGYTYQGETLDLVEGEMVIGSYKVNVFEVPGHSPCGTALYIDKYLFCGDILFAGSIGRSDFTGGDQLKLVEGIKNKLLVLPEDTIVCPGHMGRTTIGREKKMNPFL
ncbi:MAG TPA: MBL fold metallo-hydrolase [Chitinispirillaceae bacterium]|nr:MBL fold metallo-hydrolase [Chitinispirillaceae bacterium]